jgi:SAM-dependent methyltransferase
MTASILENRTWNGALIPPAPITPCGHLTDSAEKFYNSACEEADRLAADIGLNENTSVLDIGCGVGRLPIGLLARAAPFSFYLGVDVDKGRVDWCLNNLMPKDARLHFQFIDMHNARYNPNGGEKLNLALPPSCIDIVYIYSVFSHLIEPDAKEYLDVIARLLRPNGVCFLTMFVADNVPPVTENPKGFGPFDWVGPLHCVLYERSWWLRMTASSGLKVVSEIPMVNTDMQTGYLLTRA